MGVRTEQVPLIPLLNAFPLFSGEIPAIGEPCVCEDLTFISNYLGDGGILLCNSDVVIRLFSNKCDKML
jgi:hypothetical protein